MGIDPALVLTCSSHLGTALQLLDGTRSPSRAAAESGCPAPELHAAIEILRAHGHMGQTQSVVTVGLLARGVLAGDIAHALGEARHRVISLPGSRNLPDVVAGSPTQCDLYVVATDAPVIPMEFLALAARQPRPFIACTGMPFGAVVGPWCTPGAGACPSCIHHWFMEQPLWGSLSAQWEHQPCSVPRFARSWATGLLTAAIEEYSSGVIPSLTGVSWELRGCQQQARRWQPHPECACAADELVLAA